MPRKYEMTWVPKRRLWRKVFRGKVYTVSCKQLREQGHDLLADTEVGSYVAANAWWHKKEFDLEAQERAARRPPLLPMEELLRAWLPQDIYDDYQRARSYAGYLTPEQERQAVEEFANRHRAQGIKVEVRPPAEGEPSEDEKRRVLAEAHELAAHDFLQQHLLGQEPLPPGLAEKLPAGVLPRVQASVTTLRGESTAAERSVGGLCDRWVDRQWKQAAAGKIVNGRAAANEGCLKHFRTFLGEGTDIEQAVTEAGLDDYYLHCRRKMTERLADPARKVGWSADYAKKVFDTARRFIRDLWELKWAEVTLPRNIDSKGFRFDVGAKAVKVWEVEEFKKVLAEAQTWRQMPLHLLLMANCGYRHQDIADIEQWEVDWLEGRIIRARSKIADHENAPVVNYKLWPTTFELLQKHRNTDHSPHARVLLTESGKPWVWEEQADKADGKKRLRSSNNINSNFAHLRKRIGFTKPLSLVRKMGATLLNASKEYRDCVPEYLGEAPTSIKDRHYVRPDPAHFDAAIEWLGRQLGQVT